MDNLRDGSTWRTSSSTGRKLTIPVCPPYDGRDDDLGHILKGRYPDMCSPGEIGCVTSHLKAIKEFYDSGEPYAIMMEDDCELDLVRFWNFTWKDFFGRIPYDWDVTQISIICTGDINIKIHKRFVNEFSHVTLSPVIMQRN